MALVYDVIQTVARGAACSHLPGTWLIQPYGLEAEALAHAEICNRCNNCPGVRYSVEAVDEESPRRAPYQCDYRRGERYALDAAAARLDGDGRDGRTAG